MLTISSERFESELLNVDFDVYQDEHQNFWFHGATICDVFDLPNPSQVIQRHVDEDWRKKFPAVRGKESWYVMEPGFYQLLHVSKHPAAKRFQRWVYSEVLPKLRAEGGYIMPIATQQQIEKLQAELGKYQMRVIDRDGKIERLKEQNQQQAQLLSKGKEISTRLSVMADIKAFKAEWNQKFADGKCTAKEQSTACSYAGFLDQWLSEGGGDPAVIASGLEMLKKFLEKYVPASTIDRRDLDMAFGDEFNEIFRRLIRSGMDLNRPRAQRG